VSSDERSLREHDVGLYLDDRNQPAGIKLFSDGKIEERLTTDSMGQFHLTRWQLFTDGESGGWKVVTSMMLTVQGSQGLVRFLRNIAPAPLPEQEG
jgi:hypothetical protein